jgi:hypothetical protein
MNACVLPRLVSHSRSNHYTGNSPQFFQISINQRTVTRQFELYYVNWYFSVLLPLKAFD